MKEVLAWLAGFGLTGAAAAAVAYWLFKQLGKGWLDSYFQKDLEGFKAAKSQELERLRADINRLADRATKFHEREYAVLPEAWGLLNKAHGAVAHAVSAFQQYPDLGRMDEVELEEFLSQSDLPESQRAKIRKSTDRNAVYAKIHTWKQISQGFAAQVEFHNYIILNGVFIDDKINEKLSKASNLLRSAMVSRQISEGGVRNHDIWTAAMKELEQVDVLVSEIKADVRARLWAIQLEQEREPSPAPG